jgi:hypothetical protein
VNYSAEGISIPGLSLKRYMCIIPLKPTLQVTQNIFQSEV